MSVVTLTAEQIAERQLLVALRLWHEEEYIGAITLGGVAEEILGKRLRKLGWESSFDNLRNVVVGIAKLAGDDDPGIEKRISSLINSTKNDLKHYSGDAALELDLRRDAIELLERAIANYMGLSDTVHSEMLDFWSSVHDT